MKTQDQILIIARWTINILILVIGFFVARALDSINTNFNQLELRVLQLEIYQATEKERYENIIQDVRELKEQQKEFLKNIADFWYNNPNLRKEDVKQKSN